MCHDCIGQELTEQVLDQANFQNQLITNQIYQEMMQFYGKQYGTQEDADQHLRRIGIDALEIDCAPESPFT